MRSQLDDVLAGAVDAGLAPGVAATVQSRERVLYRGAHGIAGLANRLMQVDDSFRIASMTKLVTSVAILQLCDEGKLELDAPLRRYLPDFLQPEVLVSFDGADGSYRTRPASRDATIRELLSHSGGYGYWFLDEPLRQASGSSPDLINPPFLMSDPGTKFAYSSSHDVAGLAVEAVSGLPLAEFFETRIFRPLGMSQTGFAPPESSERLVQIGVRGEEGIVFQHNEMQGQAPRGGGGLYSTLDDYGLFLRCLLGTGAPLLSEESAAEVGKNQIGGLEATVQTTVLPSRTNDFIFMDGSQKFGLGVMVETRSVPGRRPLGSFGWAGIFNTYYWVDTSRGLAATIMMQVRPFSDPGCVEVLRRFEQAVYASLG